jgi:hypothetical protein
VTLSWSPSPGATSYNVKRSANSGGEVTITNVTSAGLIDLAPTNSSLLYYKVSALNVIGESPNSLEVSAVVSSGPGGWLLFDNFNGDTNGPLTGQTGSGGLGTGWLNFGSGNPTITANGGPFGNGPFGQVNTNAASGAGSYEGGLGIPGTSTASTVFLQFSLPGIQPTNGQVGAVGSSNVVSVNFEVDTVSTPTDAAGSASVQLNYDNSSNGSPNGFRLRNGGAFVNSAINSGGAAYVPVPGNTYNLWFVINAATGSFQTYLADASVSGTNKDSGGLGSTPTLLYGSGSATSSFTFRNGVSGAALNTFAVGLVDACGTVAQAEFDNIYVDRNAADLSVPVFTRPRITAISLNGSALTLSATNGPANGAFSLLMSTNVSLPLSQWTRVLTNTFDGAGNLNLTTNIVSPGVTHEFYLLQLP